jgi:hypothetical protein
MLFAVSAFRRDDAPPLETALSRAVTSSNDQTWSSLPASIAQLRRKVFPARLQLIFCRLTDWLDNDAVSRYLGFKPINLGLLPRPDESQPPITGLALGASRGNVLLVSAQAGFTNGPHRRGHRTPWCVGDAEIDQWAAI